MIDKINIFSDQWVDIVFQNKNKLYGAYDLRKTSSKRHAKALLIAVSVFLVAILSPILIKELSNLRKHDGDKTVRTLVNVNLEKPKEDIPKPIVPPPPPVRNQMKFVPPVIKKDEDVPEEPPIINIEVQKSTAAVSTADVKGNTDAPEVAPQPEVESTEPFVAVEQMPEFEGGEKALFNFINSNIRYPVVALENGIFGRVIVRFAVDKNGAISSVSVIKGIGGGCDEEAIRIVKRMPNWKPGKQGGRAVPVWYTLPILFTISQ